MYAEMTEQLLQGKLITVASSALITGPHVNRRLRATLQERMEWWEEGGMVRGGIIGWETGGGEGGMQGEKKEHLSVQSAARAFREIFCSKRNVEPEQRINIQGKSTAKDPT